MRTSELFEGTRKYPSESAEAEHKGLKAKVAAAAKAIYDLYGGYAHVHLYITDDESDLSVILPHETFDEDEFEWDTAKIGIQKAFKDNDLDLTIVKHVFHVDKRPSGDRDRALEVKLAPKGQLLDWLNAHGWLSTGKAFRARKYKR